MSLLKKLWHFLWHDDSLWSWVVNLVLAFLIVKFLLYPGIGWMLDTDYPIVAVVSGSMEHDETFAAWWGNNKEFYAAYNITQEQFQAFSFSQGFNKGDIIVLHGEEPKAIKVGEVIVYQNSISSYPIIHRVIALEETPQRQFITKGDHNTIVDPQPVTEEQIAQTGVAVFRIPYLGWIKLLFIAMIGGP